MRSPPESWLIGRIRLPAGIAWKLWSAGPDGADGGGGASGSVGRGEVLRRGGRRLILAAPLLIALQCGEEGRPAKWHSLDLRQVLVYAVNHMRDVLERRQEALLALLPHRIRSLADVLRVRRESALKSFSAEARRPETSSNCCGAFMLGAMDSAAGAPALSFGLLLEPSQVALPLPLVENAKVDSDRLLLPVGNTGGRTLVFCVAVRSAGANERVRAEQLARQHHFLAPGFGRVRAALRFLRFLAADEPESRSTAS